MAFIKKYLPFILLNIAISAITVLAVLFIWDWHQKSKLAHVPAPQPTAAISNTPSENTPEAISPISTTSPSKTNQPGESQVSIQLISGVGDLNLEYILIRNTGNSKLSLLDWSLRGSEQKSIHIKSDIMLNPGGAIKIYSKTGTDSALSIYLNSQQAYWKSGIVVTLHDPDLVERARYEIP